MTRLTCRGCLRGRWIVPGLAVASAAVVAGCSSGSAAAPGDTSGGSGAASVRAAYVPAGTFLPVLVAKDTGTFGRHQLNVTLTPPQHISAVPDTLGRQFDIGPATAPDLIKAAGHGIDVVAVAGGSSETPSDAQMRRR